MEKLFGSSAKAHISLARLAQGSKEFNGFSDEEIADIINAWEQHVCENASGRKNDHR